MPSASHTSVDPKGAEPGILKRLRRAVQSGALTFDISAAGEDEQALAVGNRLAQSTVRYLTEIDALAGQRLCEELRRLAGPAEFDLLMEDRCYTFFHVIQFLFEYAKHYADTPEPDHFCARMGRGGGGIEVDPDREIISLARLLVTAMPPASEGRGIGLLMQTLSPLVFRNIFAGDFFQYQLLPEGENRLHITLRYADRSRVEELLQPFGLAADVGVFFLNAALHIQGATRLALDTLAENADDSVAMSRLVESRSSAEKEEMATTCSCDWTVSWKPDIRLNRLPDEDRVLEQGRTVYEALIRKDYEYYLERIKTLELRIRALEEGDRFHDLIGTGPGMQQLYRLIEQVAASDLTVLVRGETGTGKELVALAIHRSSTRRDQPFVPVNCAAFSENLLESELFGHEKGAFTGADRTRPGRFEKADGGTLFLDEVGDIPLMTQVKLLRVLESRTFERVGGTEPIQVDVRIVGATNRDLEEMISEGMIREDFYFRLHVLPVDLPPLRQRLEDLPQLAQHFLEQTCARSGREIGGLSRGAMKRLTEHRWPGNIRELRSVVERAVVVYARGKTLTESDVSKALGASRLEIEVERAAPPPLNLRQRQFLTLIGRRRAGTDIAELMASAEWGRDHAGHSRRTLQNDLRKLTDLGYLSWYKSGSARVYAITPQGDALRTQLESAGTDIDTGEAVNAEEKD